MNRHRIPRRLRERLLAPVLVVYLAALALAALPGAVRPGFLDVPTHLARRLLQTVGVSPGIAVFVDAAGVDLKWRAVCIVIRGYPEALAPVALHPPGGSCRTSGFRFRLPPLELALFNMLQQSRFHALAHLRDPARESDGLRRDAILASLASHFCARDAGYTAVELVWLVQLQSYATGEQSFAPLLTFGWNCAERRIAHEAWYPDHAAV